MNLRWLRRAATALACVLAVSAGLSAQALVTSRPSGVRPQPHGGVHESVTGVHPGGPRGAEPELLRPSASARAAAEEPPPIRAAEESANAAAGNGQTWSSPWITAPHLHVLMTGDAWLDGTRLHRLSEQLATPLDPQRISVASLADDVHTDQALAAALGPSGALDQDSVVALVKTLRSASLPLNHADLTAELEPLRGHVLMVLMHVEQASASAAFRGSDGHHRQVSIELLEAAARDAGVQLLMMGCRSGRHASAGFIDNLNSLDAARAMVRAVLSRPASIFELFAALSSDGLAMQIDPVRFHAEQTVTLTAGDQGQAVSSLHWGGTLHVPPAPQAAAAAESRSDAREARQGLQALAAISLASLLVGLVWTWRERPTPLSRASWLGMDALGHLLGLPLLLSTGVEAVSGSGGVWWSWGSALVLLLTAWGCHHVAVNEDKYPTDRTLLRLTALRLALAALPFLLVAVMRTGLTAAPAPLLALLGAWYALGRRLPGPVDLVLGGCVVYWLGTKVQDAVEGWRRRRQLREAWQIHSQALTVALDRAGVAPGRARNDAVRCHALLADECALPPGRMRWDQVSRLSEFKAADPWTRQQHQRWLLVSLPVEREGEAVRVLGLLRADTKFVHLMPHLLARHWEQDQVSVDALPALLHRVAPRLRRGDFLTMRPIQARARIVIGGIGLALATGLAWWALGAGEDGHASTLGLASAGVLGLLVGVLPLALLAREGLHRRSLEQARPASAGPGPMAAPR